MQEKLHLAYTDFLRAKEIFLQENFLRLEGNNPRKPLEKGYLYAEICNKNNKAVKSVQDLELNDCLQLHVFDGTIQTRVEQISRSNAADRNNA